MEFRILGPLEVSAAGRPVAVVRQKQRALLAALLLRAGQVVSVDRLLDDLWGETPPASAKASLQNTVSMLRKLIGPDLLLTRPPGYMLDVAPEQVDVLRFEQLLAEGKEKPPADRASCLREALRLWRGPALADVAFEAFAEVEADRLEELRTAAREDLLEAELALGRHDSAIPELETLVAEQPFRERPRAQLMLALYRSGRQAEALEAYQSARRFLGEELGLEPGPPLQQLQQAILRQDPALDAPLRAPAAVDEERRKTVTILFADLVDSTRLASELDPEAYRSVLQRYYRTARAALERHGGMVEKFIGDAVVGAFGVPTRHEDDALRAVRAATDLAEGVRRLSAELERTQGVSLRLRTGINTGEAIIADAGSAELFATGYSVNVAAKLEQCAEPDEILLGAATFRLVRDAVTADAQSPLELGGKATPIPVFRLTGITSGAPGVARRLEAPLIGRAEEVAALRNAFDEARKHGGCRVVTVLGDADLPIAEVVRQLAPDGSEAAIAALLEGDPDATQVARRVRELTGMAEGAAPAHEAFWAVRRLLEAVARQRPVLLELEDVHWAEPTLLDLVGHLGEHGSSAPILVLCLARPDLVDLRPGWPVSITLPPLTGEESGELIANLPGASDVFQATHDRIAEIAEGNALFAEQLLAHVVETGEELAQVPPSIEALLASRLDLLPEDERVSLECAAVIGREFWADAVAALSGHEPTPLLEELIEKRLVRAGEDGFSFHHVLIRDVAYAGITKRRRSELHERAAELLDERDAGVDEIVGYHLEQAYRYRAELGPVDRQARKLAEDAGQRLGSAGVRAWRVGDAPAATNLLERSAELLPEGHAARVETLRELGQALWALGEVERADSTLGEAIDAAAAARNRGMELLGQIDLAYLRLFSDPEGRAEELLDLAGQAIPVLEALGDDRSLGRTWLALGYVHGGLHGRYAEAVEALERASAHYRRHGWLPAPLLRDLAAAFYSGPAPVDEAVSRCRALLVGADPSGEASVRLFLAGFEAMRGQFAAARRAAAEVRSAYADLGWTVTISTAWAPVAADIETLADDGETSERILRESCIVLERVKEHVHLATQAGKLADVMYARSLYDEAERWCSTAELYATTNDLSAQLSWRAVRAKLLAQQGAIVDAEMMGRETVERAEATDALNARARASLDLAEVLRLGGREGEASRCVEGALLLYEQKGNRAAARKAQVLLQELARPDNTESPIPGLSV